MGPRPSVIRRLSNHPALLAGMLLFAFFPTLTFLGHWDALFAGHPGPEQSIVSASQPAMFDVTVERAAEQAEQIEHAQHCHTELGSCSGQPVPAGFGLFIMREVLLRPPAVALAVLRPQIHRAPPSLASAPPTPPPRYS
jgi:hypothetical protein